MLEDGAEAEGGEEGERANDEDRGNKEGGEERTSNRESPCRGWRSLLRGQISRDCEDRDRHKKRPNSVARPVVTLYHCVLALSPAKAEPLLPVALV